MNHADHNYKDCPELRPGRSPISAALLPWLPLLRRLHSTGWEHINNGHGEHVWYRNRFAVNAQQITWNLSGASISIGGRTLTDTAPKAVTADLLLAVLGAFDAAPAPVYPPPTAAQLAARERLLTRAANDPTVADDTFVVIRQAFEGRL